MDTTHCSEAPSRYAVDAEVPVGADAIHPEPWERE
jgi:hypothetical protein